MQIWGEIIRERALENLHLFHHKSPPGICKKRTQQEKLQYVSISLKVSGVWC